MTPSISIIIPVYNRSDLIRYTLESLRRASARLAVETIVVDDGSDRPVAEDLARLGYTATRILRQQNQGLLFARLAGLQAATGRYVLFLDSDDLVGPNKLQAQVQAMDDAQADVSYTDVAHCTLEGAFDDLALAPAEPYPDTRDAAAFYIDVQPAPHSPVFRTSYLRRVVAEAFLPPQSLYNPVAEIWFYHNAAPRPARITKVPGAHTIGGSHPGSRLTNHWEQLAVASLAVMEGFARRCPKTPSTADARRRVGEKAFRSWRRLPRGFSKEFADRQLEVWRRLAGRWPTRGLGGPLFVAVARLIGPVSAGRLFKRLRNGSYDSCRTLPDVDLAQLMAKLPDVAEDARAAAR